MNLKIKGLQLKNDNNDYKIINISNFRCTFLVSEENIGEYLLNLEKGSHILKRQKKRRKMLVNLLL